VLKGLILDNPAPREEVGRAERRPDKGVHFAHAVDLGCGTGLMGESLRGSVSYLAGVDLSAAMLKKAAAKRIYDRLDKADLAKLALPGGEKPDLVTAADVFMYVGALDGIFARVAAMLAPGGFFAFSVEKHDGPEPMLLRPTRRFAHSEAYLRELLAANGFSILSLSSAIIRQDAGGPIEGLLVVAASQDAGALSRKGEIRRAAPAHFLSSPPPNPER
jgi:predicted TPR repeat methyltransferase